MANTLDIEVELKGADKAQKGLKSVGDTAGNVAQRFDKANSHLGEGISSLSDNVTELGGSFKELGSSISTVGATGARGLLGLVPAIGGVVMAGMALYDTFKNITGAAQEAENAQEAMAAAAADLQSKLEELAEKGVIPTTEQLQKYASANFKAQIAKERVQMAGEKLTKVLGEEEEAQRKLNEAHLKYELALEKSKGVYERFARLEQRRSELEEAREEHTKTTVALNRKMIPYLMAQEKAQKLLAESAKQHKDLEETSLEATLSRVKEKQTELANLTQMEAVLRGSTKQEEDSLKRQAKLTADLLALKVKESDKDVKALSSIEKKLDAQIEAYDQENLLISQSIKEEQRASQQISKSRVKTVKDTGLQERALRKQQLLQAHQLQIATLQSTNASALELLELRYQQQRQLAENNNTLLLTLDLKYETEKTNLIKTEEAKRRAEEAKRLDEANKRELHRREFIISNLEFDAEMLEDGTKKELTILELKYRRERELKQNSEAELTELSRRYNIERQKIEAESINAQIEKVSELTSTFGSGFAEAAYSAIFFGDSFKESMADIIGGLGKQAAVEALIQTAKGTAALILNPAVASNHFTSAGIFAGAAVAAGTASAALGGGGGGTSSPSTTSPTGLSQIAPEPERERAETAQTVFNINFGGAVVYDTRQAAERAFADRLTQLQNTRRRGAPRRTF